ncbi:hypothetical protein GJQ57_08745 [Ralstonia pickettii]|uniref:Uncharacterized protein n=1 Tax=Ralstonia pickettii TaxID=329 RepID=A0A7X2HLI6_RALPI|nr:hypothetical protein [Ralstonia pickettii]MRS98743.1 hypothetical protein [Ralstonia pickettii]
MKSGRKVKPFEKIGITVYGGYEYAADLEREIPDEIIRVLKTPRGDKEREYDYQCPHKTLALVDKIVNYIEENNHRSPTCWGAKFSFVQQYEDDTPFDSSAQELVLAESSRAFNFYGILRAFYQLLCFPEYGGSKYCSSIEAAREALLTVYPVRFEEIPPTDFPRPEGVTDSEWRRGITKLAGPEAKRFNGVIDKIAEIVNGREYRAKVAKEKYKIGERVRSVTALINGLLEHHKHLTVVAVRLSIHQGHGVEFVGAEMRNALNRLLGDRRNDELLDSAIGFFWVLHERIKVGLHRRLPTIRRQNTEDSVALHFDLVMFFDQIRYREVDAITRHIGACWNVVTGMAGFYKALNAKSLTPLPARWEVGDDEDPPCFPLSAEFVGLVGDGTPEAGALRTVAKAMVASAILCQPVLIQDKVRRYGKSDLLTGCGLSKVGRGTKSDRPGVKNERPRRPKYIPERKSQWE